MILQTILPKYYNSRANQVFSPPFGIDSPDSGFTTKEKWNNYTIKNYNYVFNNWAFRGGDYTQYKDQPVNICLGDSFTLNVGGPIDHSWPAQLSKYFEIPTLNFGIDGAGNDTIQMVYDYLCAQFDVQNTFVMYSFFHRRYHIESKELKHDVYGDEENFNYFEKNKLKNVYYTFLPSWCWSDEETYYLKKYYNKNLLNDHVNNYIDNHRDISEEYERFFIPKEKYNVFKGVDWPSYDDFIAGVNLNNDIQKEIFVTRFKNLLILSNRDGFHLNYIGNKIVCDYFLNQLNRTLK